MTSWLCATALAGVVLVGRRDPYLRLGALRPSGTTTQPQRFDSRLLGCAVIGTGLAAARISAAVAVGVGLSAVAAIAIHRRRATVRAGLARAASGIELSFALAGELRAGRTGAEALELVHDAAGPYAGVVDAAARAARRGEGAAAALMAGAHRDDDPGLRIIATAWQVTEQAGGQVALVLERVGESLVASEDIRLELATVLAGPRSTATVLAGLPVAGIALGQAVGAHPLALLLYRPVGWGLLCAAAGCDALGVWLMRRITRLAAPP